MSLEPFLSISATNLSETNASFVDVKHGLQPIVEEVLVFHTGKFPQSFDECPEEPLDTLGKELDEGTTSNEVKLLVNDANYKNEERIAPSEKLKVEHKVFNENGLKVTEWGTEYEYKSEKKEFIESCEEKPKIAIKSTSATFDDKLVIVTLGNTQNNVKNTADSESEETEPLQYVKKEEDEGENTIEYADFDKKVIVKEETVEGTDEYGRLDICGEDLNINEQEEQSFSEQKYGKAIKFKCKFCSKRFTAKHNRRDHEMAHMQVLPFSCEKCGKSFVRKHQLTKHEFVHTNKSRFECKICGKRTASNHGLKYHEMAHKKERPFSCQYCGKSFVWKCQLAVHIFAHTKESPFKCKFCGKLFPSKYILKKHEETYTKERPFLCTKCGKSFTQECQLTKHEKVHAKKESRLKCKFCSKQFTTKQSLKNHEAHHTKEYPFSCQKCGKPFIRKHRLTEHERLHSN